LGLWYNQIINVICKTTRLAIALVCILFLFADEGKAQLLPEGIGARAIGMGSAYVALAGEPDAIFLNPASLAELSVPGYTGTYLKLLNLTDYYLLGGASPSPFGTLGIGYLKTSAGDSYDNTLSLSLGRNLFSNLSTGINLKYFSQRDGGTGNTGIGYDADLGLLYKPIQSLKIGFLQRNLFAAFGSTMKWSDGTSRTIPNASRLGLIYQLEDINLGLDYEFYPQSSKSPLLMLGAEWWYFYDLAFRLGLDQRSASETYLTAGFSYLFSGYKFDYAYEQLGSIGQSTFSFSYGIFRLEPVKRELAKVIPIVKEEEKKKEFIQIKNPLDKSIVFENSITIEGKVASEVKRLEIDGKNIPLKENNFIATKFLNTGKNSINLIAFDNMEAQLERKRLRILNLQKFTDVPDDYWVKMPVSILATLKLFSGYRGGTFIPEGNITRGEIYNLLLKLLTISGRSTEIRSGEAVSRPDELISRAEAVMIVARLEKLPESKNPEPPFPDIPENYWATKEIASAKEAGYLRYLEGKSFEPEKKITRAEIALMISKTRHVSLMISELLDFETGY